MEVVVLARTPPSSTRAGSASSIYVFSKSGGTKASTFYSRIVERLTFRVNPGDGSVHRVVRYAGRYWPVYEPETFPFISTKWVSDCDHVYGPGCSKLMLPLEHPYLFECDQPFWHYDM